MILERKVPSASRRPRLCRPGPFTEKAREAMLSFLLLLGGQWIPEPREAEAREVAIVASSELGHAMMPQSEGQPGVEDDASSDVRLGGQTPQFVHYAGGLPRIVNQHPRRMLAEGSE